MKATTIREGVEDAPSMCLVDFALCLGFTGFFFSLHSLLVQVAVSSWTKYDLLNLILDASVMWILDFPLCLGFPGAFCRLHWALMV